jgi:dGTPase
MLTEADLENSRLYREARLATLHEEKIQNEEIVRYQTVRRLINALVTDLVVHIDSELTKAGISGVEQIRHAGRPLAAFSRGISDQVKELRQIMRDRLYRHYRVSRMTQKAGRVLRHLFEAYMAEPRQLPEHVLARSLQEPLPRVIADYIAGMTDRFALDEYRKLFDPDERV